MVKKEGHVIVEYTKDIFRRKIPLKINIPEKQYPDGSNTEVIDLKRMNRLLW